MADRETLRMSAEEIASMESDLRGDEPNEAATDVEVAASGADEGAAADESASARDDTGEAGREEDGSKQRRDRTVPHAALHAEREEHKKTRRQLQEQEVRYARLEERLNAINEAMSRSRQPEQAQQPAVDEIPDENEDPVAALAWVKKFVQDQRATQQRQQQETARQTEEQQRAEREWNVAFRTSKQVWDAAVAEDPQVNEAYQALRESHRRELSAVGWSGQPLENRLQQIEADYILTAYRNQWPIDQLVRNVAESRGWRPKTAAEQQQQRQQPTADERLDRMERAQQASKSLSTTGGGTPGSGKMTLETLDRMDDHELQNLVRNLNKRDQHGVDRALEKMMGLT